MRYEGKHLPASVISAFNSAFDQRQRYYGRMDPIMVEDITRGNEDDERRARISAWTSHVNDGSPKIPPCIADSLLNTGAGDNRCVPSTNWSAGTLPGPDDDVVIDDTTNTLTMDSHCGRIRACCV